jgi:hypothetical protein
MNMNESRFKVNKQQDRPERLDEFENVGIGILNGRDNYSSLPLRLLEMESQ